MERESKFMDLVEGFNDEIQETKLSANVTGRVKGEILAILGTQGERWESREKKTTTNCEKYSRETGRGGTLIRTGVCKS